jgi:hypothetical protein
LKLTLSGFQGEVRKKATVESNDPDSRKVSLIMQGKVRSLIAVTPSTSVYIKGRPDAVGPHSIELTATSQPFRIEKTESDLEGKVRHELQTLEAGRKYRLEIANLLRFGTYGGVVKLTTDLPQKREIVVRVNGAVEGELEVSPALVFIGRLQASEPERTGRVEVVSTRRRPFEIKKLTYDQRLIRVVREPLSDRSGFSLTLIPILENVRPGTRHSTPLIIENDLAPDEVYEVEVQVVNFPDSP